MLDMNAAVGIHRGFLRKYGGFMFKQWKEKYLVLTLDGSLVVCRDAATPPDQVVSLQSGCESIVEGREILDLPKLPAGGRRDCCFALILPQYKFLLLLTDNPDACILWLHLLRKVREGVSSMSSLQPTLQRQQSIMSPSDRETLQRQQSLVSPCIRDRETLQRQQSIMSPSISDRETLQRQQSILSPSISDRETLQRQQSILSPSISDRETLQRQQSILSPCISDRETLQRQQSIMSPSISDRETLQRQQSIMSPCVSEIETLQRQKSIVSRCTSDREPLGDSSSDKDPGSPRTSMNDSTHLSMRGGSLRDRGGQGSGGTAKRSLRSMSVSPGPRRMSDCLRHGNSSDARAVRAVCLLMGSAAASNYLGSCSASSPLASRAAAEMPTHGVGGVGGFSELPPGGTSFHGCSQDVDSPPFDNFDFEADSDFDAFDCGGFSF